jgi:hypothetical protein
MGTCAAGDKVANFRGIDSIDSIDSTKRHGIPSQRDTTQTLVSEVSKWVLIVRFGANHLLPSALSPERETSAVFFIFHFDIK